ncbi:MAG: GTPase [Planctomycetota bacterium]
MSAVRVVRVSAHGRGAIGIVQVSGAAAAALLEPLFSSQISATHARYGSFVDQEGQVIDDGIVVPLPAAPEATYWTTLHGNPVLVNRWLDVLLAAGAQLDESAPDALWGEPRNVVAAEAEALLPRARSWGAFQFLVEQRDTGLALWCERGDDVTIADVESLLAVAQRGCSLFAPPRVVLAGAPNAGKSTLFNSFVGQRRVIAHAAPGTTRDLITEEVLVGSYPVQLQDGAGLRATADPVEQSGVARMQAALTTADLVVWLRAPGGIAAPPQLASSVLEVWSKVDLQEAPAGQLGFSTETGAGIAELRQAIAARVCGGSEPPSGVACPFLPRHVECLQQCHAALASGASPLPALRALCGHPPEAEES